jgi:hypothetical protein
MMTEVQRKHACLAMPALIAIALCMFPAMAFGQMPVALSVETIQEPAQERVEYRLGIQSGSDGAQFGIQYRLPTWPTSDVVFGSPMEVSSVNLSGAGSVRSTAELLPKPKRRIGCNRGAPHPYAKRLWIEMPPNSTVVLSFHLTGTDPAWPNTRYAVSFSTFPVESPSATEVVPLADITVQRLAPRGTRIELIAQRQVGAMMTPALVGRTFPAFRNARISLRAVRRDPFGGVGLEDWGDPQSSTVSLGAVQTDSRGYFRVPAHRLTANGSYAVIARSQARGNRAADWNCGPFFYAE